MASPSDPPPRTLVQAVPSSPRMFLFQAFNSVNFQIALGPPLILLARRWGGSSTYIGWLTALVPLLTTLQLYVAPRVEYIGFRKVMLSGWAGRNVMLMMVSLLPLLATRVPSIFLLQALFVLIFLFNFLRGIATASWVPWVTALVPENWRGRYLSLETLVINGVTAGSFFLSGWLLGTKPTDGRFAFLYFLAFAAGWISIGILNRIACPPPLPGKPVLEPIWRWGGRLWQDLRFRRVVRANAVYSVIIGAWSAFTIVFLRDQGKLSDGSIMYVVGASTLGAVSSSWLWGIAADRFGSKPVVALSSRLLLITMICWLMMALGLIPITTLWGMLLYVLASAAVAGFQLGVTRYAMNNAPKKQPVLFLTLFSVISSICTGLAPILGGMFLDALGHETTVWGPLQFGPYTSFYLILCSLVILTKVLVRAMPDRDAAATHVVLHHMIIDYPLRPIQAIYKILSAHPDEPQARPLPPSRPAGNFLLSKPSAQRHDEHPTADAPQRELEPPTDMLK